MVPVSTSSLGDVPSATCSFYNMPVSFWTLVNIFNFTSFTSYISTLWHFKSYILTSLPWEKVVPKVDKLCRNFPWALPPFLLSCHWEINEVTARRVSQPRLPNTPTHQHCPPQNVHGLSHQVATADIKMSCPVHKGSTNKIQKKIVTNKRRQALGWGDASFECSC